VAGLTEKRSMEWAQRRAYRQSSGERHATRARQGRQRLV